MFSNKTFTITGCSSENFDVQNPLKYVFEHSSLKQFIEHGLNYEDRALSYLMILTAINVSYIFTCVRPPHGPFFRHPSNDIFNTLQNFISISILGSFFRVPEYRHEVENFPHCAKKVRPSGGKYFSKKIEKIVWIFKKGYLETS